jgi:sugar phosphate isomerase/epimerase
MEPEPLQPRLGLNVPYEWWPAAPSLKEIEAAGFAWVQVPSPPASVLSHPRESARHAAALASALGTAGLRHVLHAPGSLSAGTAEDDRAFEGLLSYAAETGAGHVVYHAAAFPDRPASEDRLLAETRSLARMAPVAERLGVTVALENLAPVFPGPDLLSFSPLTLRTMANRIGSPAVGLCLDVGHANVVAGLRRTETARLVAPVLDRVALFHLHDNLGARRGAPGPPELDPIRLDLHLPPGRGTLDWTRISPLLRRHRAPLMLEIHPPRPSPSALHERALAVLGGLPETIAA